MEDFICGYVAVAGRPNVGKSTLVNKLVSYPLSIVSRKPQTTRHKLLGILTGEGYQAIFLDCPGLMVPKYALQNLMVKTAWGAIEEADLLLLVAEPRPDDLSDETGILAHLKQLKKQTILAINKIDLIGKPDILPLIEFYRDLYPFAEIVPVSALKDDGLDVLKGLIVSHLPHQPPFYPPGEVTDRPQRFFVAELIRQKVFERYGEEVPYSVAVVVEEYKEREGGKDYVKAIIVCEKPSQKAILIGRKGEAIKRLGQTARASIEGFISKEIFLELRVEVRENWRREERIVKQLGQT
ncbi:MAG TPA: GTPase Era [bacterium]|nr:GTPase Era [bacterium]